MPIVWMGTTGGKRMPIDAVMKEVWLQEPGGFRKAQGYTSHLSTCPMKDIAAPENPQEKKT